MAAGCAAGETGCACDAGRCDDPEASCQDGLCAATEAPCVMGELGCACDAGQCGVNPEGDPLSCVGNVCVELACDPGQTGCTCEGGERCEAQSDECVGGVCQPRGCSPGELGCACDGGACGAGLFCQDGQTCVEGAGFLGGACLDTGRCHPGYRCDRGLCAFCNPGSYQCVCRAGACNGGLTCYADVCLTEQETRTAPEAPRCYTPCEENLQGGQGVRVCGPDKLMEGCVGARSCVEGACLAPGEAPRACTREAECPDWQTCIQGRCLSDCEDDSDCGGNQLCWRKVCRQTCSPDDSTCPAQSRCEPVDGGLGVCRGLTAAHEDVQAVVPGVLRVDAGDGVLDGEASLEFSNLLTTRRVTIYNESDEPQRLLVRKRRHVSRGADGEARAVSLDADDDGVDDAVDNCLHAPNPTQGNADGDTLGDACDPDDDNDGVTDGDDNCPLAANADQVDLDRDGVGDACVAAGQPDADGDGVGDADDNCASKANAEQADADNDGVGDACAPPVSRPCDPSRECPLFWLLMAEGTAPLNPSRDRVQELELELAPRASAVLSLGGAGDGPGASWSGAVEVLTRDLKLNPLTLRMGYRERPDGHWAGKVYYFANFGTNQLDEWRALPNPPAGSTSFSSTRDEQQRLDRVGNALIQRWGGLRAGRVSFESFQAALTSLQSESWRWGEVRRACDPQGRNPNRACYPSATGVDVFTTATNSSPLPSGAVELPMAVNLTFPDPIGRPAELVGMVDSGTALQYAGAPAVRVRFANAPNTLSRDLSTADLVFLEEFSFDVEVGGRYMTRADDVTCAMAPAGYQQVSTPWLVLGFNQGVSLDERGARARYECRDAATPFTNADPAIQTRLHPFNLSLSRANPIPDARARRRTIRLVDGALINERFLFVIFEERFDSIFGEALDPEGFSAYGYMMLQRQPTTLSENDADGDGLDDPYDGSALPSPRAPRADLLATTCAREVLDPILGRGVALGANNARALFETLMDGRKPSGAPSFLPEDGHEQVHYYCEDTGYFDGGPFNTTPRAAPAQAVNDDTCDAAREDDECEDGGFGSVAARCPLGTDLTDCGPRTDAEFDERVACPPGSRVEFFTLDARQMTQADVAELPCQMEVDEEGRGSCQEVLARWKVSRPAFFLQSEPFWRCAQEEETLCSEDRFDLRAGKRFYAAQDEEVVFDPLLTQVEDAFRYKTRFRNRQGTNLGFAPEICIPDSDQNPYCYEPEDIETARARVDCLVHLWRDHYEALGVDAQGRATAVYQRRLTEFLQETFSETTSFNALGQPSRREGFERLNAELMVMLGDESFTRSFKSRFDLAGVQTLAFEGSRFEPNGIDLSGIAGYEMYSLYQSVQYYEAALERFYRLSPQVWASLAYGDAPRNFVTEETATTYMDRLTRASTQKSRAYSTIARRYLDLNRPDLARQVIERGYTGTYMESVVLSRIMSAIVQNAELARRDQVREVLENAQRRYRAAMLDMQSVYTSISDNVTVFGFAPDYIPFPTLDTRAFVENNAFEIMIQRAQAKLRIAREREDLALANNRAFETDAAQFQSELVRIRNTYENQLAELCGTLVVNDGAGPRGYPAIEKYAYLDPLARLTGDPCGLVPDGLIRERLIGLEVLQTDMRRLIVAAENIHKNIEIERASVAQQCELVNERADFVYEQAGEVQSLEADIRESRFIIEQMEGGLNKLTTGLGFVNSLGACFAGGATGNTPSAVCVNTASSTLALYGGAAIATQLTSGILGDQILDKEREIAQIQRETARWETQRQCDQVQIEGNKRALQLLLELRVLDVDMLKVSYQIEQQLSELERLRQQARRLQLQQQEAEQLLINVEAARNDPNIRIYRNDAIINADISFEEALRELYRATRVFEYYTSQSYADREQLFLIRLVARGDYNLENYLQSLQDAFFTFEDRYGLPDTRVLRLSLRDDILKIPRVDDDGRAMDDNERSARLAQELRNPARLDRNGYLTFTFSTTLDELSPLTRNHKVLYTEVDLLGRSLGDPVGRVYLRQRGTGTVQTLNNERLYYRFPEHTAVVNTTFNSARTSFSPEIYRSFRFRDRPLANSSWDLIINQRDELDNQDINLQSLSDVLINVYYTDFTSY